MANSRTAPEPHRANDPRVTPQADSGETQWHAQSGAGAIPPTGGVPPEDAPPNAGYAPHERATLDDLVDVLDLLLRGARKGLGSVDQEVESSAKRALLKLQQLDVTRLATLEQVADSHRADLENLTKDIGRDLAAVVERIAARIDAAFPSQGGD